VVALELHREHVRTLRAASERWSIADGDLVFPGRDGSLRDGQTVGKELADEVRRLGLPPLTLHGMRHTCTTLLMIGGAHPKAVDELIGDRVETLMRVYTHVTVDHRRSAVDALEQSVGLIRTDSRHATTEGATAG
jgi:integrase